MSLRKSLCWCWAITAGCSIAQTVPEPPPHTIGGITVSASLRSRLEVWDWFQGDSGASDYGYSGNILRIGLAQRGMRWGWTAEFGVPFLLGVPANASGFGANYYAANHASNAAMLFPKQLFLTLNPAGAAHTVRIGRFEFNDGGEMPAQNATLAAVKRDRIAGRLLGNFGWPHVARSFDGIQYSLNQPGGNFTLLGAVPTRGVFQVDGWGWNRVAFGYTSYTRAWGKRNHSAETRVFALYYDDFRHVLKTDNRPLTERRADLSNIRLWTFGGHSVHAVETRAATLDLALWGAAQTGGWGAQEHRAHALDVEGGIQPRILPRFKPWLRAGFFDGSGDGNPNDARHETFFQIVPTPRPFARFPFFNMMNNRDVFGMLILRPSARFTWSSEFHALGLSNASDLWYAGGGVFQPWTFGYTGRSAGGAKSLANLYDAQAEIRLNSRTTFTVYFGYAQGRAAATAVYPNGKDGSLGYLELLLRL